MRLHLIIAATLLGLAGCNQTPPEPQVVVTDAWVRLPVVSGRPGAAYFTLSTNNDPTRLVSVTSPRVERIELHESRMENGVMRMGPTEDLTFGDELKFESGGKHAMLFGIDPALKAGDAIPLTLTFDPAPPVTVEAEVRTFGDDGHGGH